MTLFQSRSTQFYIVFATLVILFIGGCAEQNPSQPLQSAEKSVKWEPSQTTFSQRDFKLLTSIWDIDDEVLDIAGTSNNNSERILIKNADSGNTIASTIATSDRNWALSIESLSVVPCRISIVSESGTLKSDVLNTPADCNTLIRNTATEISILSDDDDLPNAIITSPQTDLSIAVNESVNFQANASNISGNPKFNWYFSGVAQNSSIQNPGNIKFTTPGVYHIALEVSDSRGLSDPSPPMRMITVTDPFSALTAQPIANIDTPAGDQTIFVGDTLNFSGSGNDPASNEIVTFIWDFNGVNENTIFQNPGDVIFNMPGIFTIILTVSDALGNTATSQVVITVNDPIANQPPVGTISSPASDLIINPGDMIDVQGSAIDPDANDPVTYFWEFDGVTQDSILQNPGSVTYANPGVYTIRLTATDNLGLADPNPPTRVITVQASPPMSSDAPNGEILTPAMNPTIMAGESIIFSATGTAAPGKEPLMYLWTFDNVAANSASKDAGSITYPDPGVFTATLLVIDATNQVDPTPAVRVITVQDPNAGGTPPEAPMMINHIVTPEMDMTIQVGDAIYFSGMVNPEINPPYTYLWLFDGAAHNSNALVPGDIVFTHAATHNVMFFAIDKDGVFDSSPAVRTITVTEPMPTPALAPIVSIVSPTGDLNIVVGDTVTFEGSVIDVSGNNLLTYLWMFSGAAPDGLQLNPAPVTFDVAGTYEITFSATDLSNMLTSDPIPPIMVTVADPTPPPVVIPSMPIAEIITPNQDIMINIGDSVSFEGNAVDTSGFGALSYLWNFDGAAPEVTTLSTDPIMFNNPGRYDVSFTVTDNAGSQGMATATVTIQVMPAGGGGGTPTQPNLDLPQGSIINPASEKTITVGDSINFEGQGINPIDNDPLNYLWDFGNGSQSTAPTPGVVTFPQVGVFTVTLTVNHDDSEFDSTPAEVIVNVIDSGADLPGAP